MASGAGANRWGREGGVPILTAVPGTAVTFDSGIWGVEAGYWTTWTFMGVRLYSADTITGWTVTIYGTIDPRAYQLFNPEGYGFAPGSGITARGPGVGASSNATLVNPFSDGGGIIGTNAGSTGLDTYSWIVLPGPAEQTGTGPATNPLVFTASGNPGMFQFKGNISAVRAVATCTAGGTSTGTLVVLASAAP
jgi:hypothetical protein